MSLTGISANRLELLQIADAVAREKSIEKEIVIEAIEEAIQKAARARYGAEHDIRVHIDPKTGEITITRVVTVVEPTTPRRSRTTRDAVQDRLADAKLKTTRTPWSARPTRRSCRPSSSAGCRPRWPARW